MALNIPFVVTWVTDWLLLAGLVAFNYHKPDEDDLTVTWSAIAVLSFIVTTNVRDELWCRYGSPDYVSKFKKERHTTLQDIKFLIQQLLLFLPLTMTLTKAGIFHYRGGLTWGTVARMYGEYYAMAFFKDQISMRYGHVWMHTANGWKHHKGHHYGKRNLRLVVAYHGSQWIDLQIETLSGPILLMIANYAITGHPSIHLFSFLLIVWGDHQAHSVNPYSVSYFCPPLDYWFLHTISHHLHHVLIDINLFFLPYHHVSPEARQKDLNVFNQAMQTNVQWGFFT